MASNFRQEIKVQDEMIGDLERGVANLHNTATNIHQESTLHSRLLDDMDADVDGTISGLRHETKYAEKIRKTSGVCYLYIAIVILLGLMILLIVIGTGNG